MPKLTVNEAVAGFTHVFEFDYVDLIALGTGNKFTIATIPAGGAVEMACVHKVTAAAGSTSVVFDVGTTSGDPDEFIDNLDADGMTVPVFNTGDQFTSGYTKPVTAVTSATTVYLKLTDAAVASLTAGKWIVGLRILNLAQYVKGLAA